MLPSKSLSTPYQKKKPHPNPSLTCPMGILSKRRGEMVAIVFAERDLNSKTHIEKTKSHIRIFAFEFG